MGLAIRNLPDGKTELVRVDDPRGHAKMVVNLDAKIIMGYLMTPYAERPLIQDSFPTLSPDEREFIMTQTTAEEWEAFAELAEEEEEEDAAK